MTKLHVVDGTFELFRGHFGSPPAEGRDGQPVGATRALMRSMASLVKQPEVTHVAIAFDHVIESYRNGLFAGYKTGEGIDPVLFSQFEVAERAASALGLVVWPMVEFEADDALATAAHRYKGDCEQVVICSPDKDLAQCVEGNRVVCLDRIRRRVLDAAGVVEKFGVEPASIPDYLALVGDSADGIPGIPRWGAKSAGTVLAHYRKLDAIPANVDDWAVKVRGAKALADNLNAERDAATLYRTLATLRTDVPLPESYDALRYRGPDMAQLTAVCEELGDDAERFANLI